MGLLFFTAHAHEGEAADKLQTAAKSAGLALSLGVIAAVIFLAYLRLHGSAALGRRLQGWIAAGGWREKLAGILLGFVRGVQTVRSWTDLTLAVAYSAAHWFLVVAIYWLVSHAFTGRLAQLSLGDCMLVLAFTLVGSAVQLPAVGGGSQALTIFAYTKIFGVESEPAVAAAIVVWLVTFAGCSLVGVPLLIREGFSLGKLRQLAEQEKEEMKEVVAEDEAKLVRPGETPR